MMNGKVFLRVLVAINKPHLVDSKSAGQGMSFPGLGVIREPPNNCRHLLRTNSFRLINISNVGHTYKQVL